MSALRDRLLRAQCPEELVTAEGERVLIRGMSARARTELYAALPPREPGQKMSAQDMAHMEAEAVILCAFDPQTKQPLFGKADRDALEDLPGSVLAALSGPAFRLSGMDAEAKDAAKNA